VTQDGRAIAVVPFRSIPSPWERASRVAPLLLPIGLFLVLLYLAARNRFTEPPDPDPPKARPPR